MIDSSNNFPYIMKVVDRMEDTADKYLIIAEQTVLFESHELVTSLFHLLSVYYIFNIQYNPKSDLLLLFLQEKVLGLPSADTRQKSPKYLSFVSAIDCFLKL